MATLALDEFNDDNEGSEMSYANNEDLVTIIDAEGTTPQPEQELGGEEPNKGEKRKREVKVRFKVWAHFTKIPPKEEECTCNYCKKVFSCHSPGGTTHLQRHIFGGICVAYKRTVGQQPSKGQTVLSFPEGISDQSSNYVWKFDQEQSRRDLTELIINRELPFNFVEDKSFQKYALGLNPKVKFVSRNTMKGDCMKIYEAEKSKLKELFLQCKPRVCLTTDTWTSKTDLPFMALTAHFIDNHWKLHKKIINFVLVPMKASGENLTDIIINCLLEWNVDKICTITMDNATTNDVVARCLQEHYSFRGALLLNGKDIQVRCWGHVLSLIVQEGLDEINGSIYRVRNAVKYVRGSVKRKLEFFHFADQECIPRGKLLSLDVCKRWNSTYLMLESALHYRRAYDRMKTHDSNFKDPPLAEDWEKARIVHDFLETFYAVTKIFSGSKYCTANVFLREIYRVLMLLRETSIEDSPFLESMATNMLVKFEKYWLEKEPNILLSIAFVLDPRFKMRKLKTIYNKMYDSYLASCMLDRVQETLRALFTEYLTAYEASCQQDLASQPGKISEADSNTSSRAKKSYMDDFYSLDEEEDNTCSKTELDFYLEEKVYPSKPDEEDSFDILDYWRGHAAKFPILSMMARDILAIPVSTVASESAFSTRGRVLNKFRSSLLPSTIEALICAQDWIKDAPKEIDFEQEFDPDFIAPFQTKS